MRRWLQYGGFAAGVVLIVFGVVAIAMGANGRSTVRDNLRQEQIVGSPDMTPAAIKAEAAKAAGSRTCRSRPAASPAWPIDQRRPGALLRQLHAHPRARGERRARPTARCRATPRPTARARTTPPRPRRAAPVSRSTTRARNVWISETALSTALNVSYMADQLALFGVVVGIALLLSGIGFIVLAAFGMVRVAATAAPPGSAGAPRRSRSPVDVRLSGRPRRGRLRPGGRAPSFTADLDDAGARARSARGRRASRAAACRGCGDGGPRSCGR